VPELPDQPAAPHHPGPGFLTVRSGEFVAIMGQSGAGKSTLLHIMGGLEPPDSGRVLVDGRDLYAMGDAERSAFRRDHIGFVFQFFNLIPSLTAAENVALPLRLRGGRHAARLDSKTVSERVRVLMDQLSFTVSRATAPTRSRRRAAEGGPGPGSGCGTRSALGRRAHRQSRPPERPRGDGDAQPPLPRTVPDHRPGHPQRAGGRVRDRVLVLADGRVVDDLRVEDGGADGDSAGFRALVRRLERHDL